MFANLKTDDNIQQEQDSVGFGGLLDTNIYDTSVSMAYVGKSESGAMSVTLHLAPESGPEIKQTLWVTSGKEKGNKNYYETKDGERRYLPGFNLFNSLCLLTVGKEAAEMETEDKVIKVYSAEAKKEVPTKVPVLTALLDQRVYTAVLKQTVDKNIKDASGAYVPTGETRTENEIDKFFRYKDKMTTAEILGQAEEATFFNTWLNKWKGQVRNRAKNAAGSAGAPVAATTAGKPTKSLFS